MSMSQKRKINYCKDWIEICSDFADISYQQKVWFEQSGSEVSSYDEDVCYLMNKAETLSERRSYLNQTSWDLINRFLRQFEIFSTSDAAINFFLEENPFNNAEWLKVVQIAREALEALKKYEGELKEPLINGCYRFYALLPAKCSFCKCPTDKSMRTCKTCFYQTKSSKNRFSPRLSEVP